MITYVTVPQYFENMEEATIGAWLIKEGEAVIQLGSGEKYTVPAVRNK